MMIPKMEQEHLKKFSVLEIIAFESRMTYSQNPEHDNCNWQSICYQRSLRFNISLREIFSKSGSPIVMKKYDESALMQISQDFRTL